MNIKGLQERGESFYNPLLSGVIADLEKQALAVESDGAKVVYLEGVSQLRVSVLSVESAQLFRLQTRLTEILFGSLLLDNRSMKPATANHFQFSCRSPTVVSTMLQLT